MSLFSENAGQFASSDRTAHAEQLMNIAVREGIAAFRVARAMERRHPGMDATEGLKEAVEFQLLQAGLSAETILGRGAGVES